MEHKIIKAEKAPLPKTRLILIMNLRFVKMVGGEGAIFHKEYLPQYSRSV